MSRRGTHRDPVADSAIAPLLTDGVLRAINEWIDTLAGPQAHVIQQVFYGMTFRAIALQNEQSIEQVHAAYRRGVSMLRHPSRAGILTRYAGYEDHNPFEYSNYTVIFDVLSRLEHAASRDEPLLRCARHGWFAPIAGQPPCPECDCPLPLMYSETKGGRPRLYCSNACRQHAYRSRARQPG